MLSRTSRVKQINVNTIVFSSSVQIGDTQYIDARAQALATQEPVKVYRGDPEHFADYPVFNLRTPLPIIFEKVSMIQMNKQPNICVDFIDVVGVSSASTLAIGNVDHIRLSSRILNIRRLTERDDVKKGG